MPPVLLHRLVDDDQWDAKDLVGRLAVVTHAAILRAGFVPYGDEARSGHLLRWYTAAQLVVAHQQDGGAADAAVLELRARGNGDVTFRAYLTRTDGDQSCLSYEADLEEDTLAPLLSCRLADAAVNLGTGSAGAWLWNSLADWVFPALFLKLRRRNDLPVASFASLPDDVKVEILKRLIDGEDLARVECVSRQLRRLVTERDGELWKAVYYDSMGWASSEAQSFDNADSWKARYVSSMQQPLPQDLWVEEEDFSENSMGRLDRRDYYFVSDCKFDPTRLIYPRPKPYRYRSRCFG